NRRERDGGIPAWRAFPLRPLLHEQGRGALELDAANVGLADQQGDVLADGPAPDPLGQISGDSIADHLERKLPALDAAVESGDVKAEARLDRQRTDLPLLQIEQEGLELRHRRAARDLPE